MSEVFTLKGSQQRASYLRRRCPKGAAIQEVLIIYSKLWGEFPPTPIFKLQNYFVNTVKDISFLIRLKTKGCRLIYHLKKVLKSIPLLILSKNKFKMCHVF